MSTPPSSKLCVTTTPIIDVTQHDRATSDISEALEAKVDSGVRA